MERNENLHEQLRQSVLSNPSSKSEYDAFSLELDLLDKLKMQRKINNLTQNDVAKVMDTSASVIARLESADSKHSPSIHTLAKYASAVGCKIKIDLVPNEETQK